MSRCPSGKRSYHTESLALDALIQYHIRNDFHAGQGPVNVYTCHDCGEWHFTSKGAMNELFENEEMIQYIQKERRAFQWESKLR